MYYRPNEIAAGDLGCAGGDRVGLGLVEQAALGADADRGALDEGEPGDQLALDRLAGETLQGVIDTYNAKLVAAAATA